MSNKIWFSLMILVVFVVAGILVYDGFLNQTPKKNYDVFAQCLAEKGFTMYGAVWCPHCKDQKNMFGSSFQYVKYVECPDNVKLCEDEGINGYPTWKFGSTTLEGIQSFEKLSELSQCKLPDELPK
jgi:hypothetical protein